MAVMMVVRMMSPPPALNRRLLPHLPQAQPRLQRLRRLALPSRRALRKQRPSRPLRPLQVRRQPHPRYQRRLRRSALSPAAAAAAAAAPSPQVIPYLQAQAARLTFSVLYTIKTELRPRALHPVVRQQHQPFLPTARAKVAARPKTKDQARVGVSLHPPIQATVRTLVGGRTAVPLLVSS